MIDNNFLKNWKIEAAKRIIELTKIGPIRLKINGKVFSILYPGQIISVNPDGIGINITLNENGLKLYEGFVGLAGCYYDSNFLGADDARQVIDSWNWLFPAKNFSKTQFEMFLETYVVLQMIFTGTNSLVLQHMMSFAVSMKKLSELNVDIDEKLLELMSKIKGDWKKFNKLVKQNKTEESLKHINILSLEISDMLAEADLSIMVHGLGFNPIMMKSPDLVVDGIKIEVKNDREYEIHSKQLDSKIERGLKQGGQLIAISTNPKKQSGRHKITWFNIEKMYISFPRALDLCKKGRKCVLLFTGSTQGDFGLVGLLR